MLYTYLAEKTQSRAVRRRGNPLFGALTYYRRQLAQLAQLIRERDSRPVFVLQVLEYPEPDGIRDVNLDDREAVERFIEAAVQRSVAQAGAGAAAEARSIDHGHLFVEALRRFGQEAGIPVIDPRPAFPAAAEERAQLITDPVHLTDAGNQRLAEAIAAQLGVVDGGSP